MSREELNQKREHILDAALRLFADKGYHVTTMQDISQAAGIAKGSVYSYFDSKEQLLLSIYEHYMNQIDAGLYALDQDDLLTAKMKLQKQIQYTFMQISKYRHFLIMHVRESAAPLNDEMKQLLIHMNERELTWYQSRIAEIYGEEIKPYRFDLAASLQALVREYVVYLLFDESQFEIDRATAFLMNLLEDMAQGMLKRKDKPLLTKEGLDRMISSFLNGNLTFNSGPGEWVRKLRERIKKADQAGGDLDIKELESVLQLLEKEWAKEKPRSVMLKSLLSYLKALQPECEWPEVKILENMADEQERN